MRPSRRISPGIRNRSRFSSSQRRTDRQGLLPAGRRFHASASAIRPTDPSRTPDSLAGRLDGDALRLYALIRSRMLASQMAPARFERVEVALTWAAGDIVLEAVGSHPDDGAPVWLKTGHYGPFVAHRRSDASLPEKTFHRRRSPWSALSSCRDRRRTAAATAS